MKGSVRGTVFQIQRFSVHDGDGLRTTVFFKGCPLRCRWCHNPEGLNSQHQVAFQQEKCLNCGQCAAVCTSGALNMLPRRAYDRRRCIACGNCAQACPTGALHLVGREMTAEEVVSCAMRDQPFYGSTGGITCSGGECTRQPEFLRAVLCLSREQGLTTAVDTCGYAAAEVLQDIAPYTDDFLYDLKAISPQLHQAWTGADNALILANYRMLAAQGARIDVRIPLIPGVNDAMDEVLLLGEFMLQAGVPASVKVIPYHSPGPGKYAQLGMSVWSPECGGRMNAAEAQTMLDQMLYGPYKEKK